MVNYFTKTATVEGVSADVVLAPTTANIAYSISIAPQSAIDRDFDRWQTIHLYSPYIF